MRVSEPELDAGDERVKASQKRKSRGGQRADGRRQGAARSTGQGTPEAVLPATAQPTRGRAATPAPGSTRAKTTTGAVSAPVVRDLTGAGWWARARRDVLLSRLLLVAALGLYLPRLGVPDKYIYEGLSPAYPASQYAAGNPDVWLWSTRPPEQRVDGKKGAPYEWTPPPLGKLI